MNGGYELFYEGGGHGGPYYRLHDAYDAARRRLTGQQSCAWIDIVARDADGVGGYGARLGRVRRCDDDPQPTQQLF